MSPRSNVRLGQNFLVDKNIANRIVEWAGIQGRDVLEIGPGRAILTDILAESARSVVAVELDARLAEELGTRFEDNEKVRIIEADSLKVDLHSLFAGRFHIVANLPYESGTAILIRLIQERPGIESMVLMLQREVCLRILAQPGNKQYGRLGVFCHLYADVEAGRMVKPGSFRPAPKVDSQVIRVTPLDRPRYEIGSEELFEEIVRASFAGRRKTLRNTLGAWLAGRVGEDGPGLLAEAGIDPSARAETVAVEAFAKLSALVHAHA